MYIILFFFFSLFHTARAQELSDVSILLPLPAMNEFSSMLEPKSASAKGELLSHEVYKFFPVLTNEADQDSIYDHNLKVVGIRLDPCFREGSETGCRRQIRFVWQPLIEARDGSGGTKTSTIDAAAHTFYQFKEAEWKSLILEWTALAQFSKLKAGLPLQIHPRLKKEGFSGKYWQQLKALLLKYCGDQNLVRATVMTVNQKRVWNFVGFDRDMASGKWSYIKIPLINRNTQSFFLSFDGLFELSEFNGGFGPVPPGQDLWLRLTSDSKKFRETKTEPELKLTVNRAFQLENPALNNPGTADCVSCHVAQTVRLWGEKSFPQWDWKNSFAQSRFTSSENLENRSVKPAETNRARAFGYFDDEPIFSQRVVNETAAVVQYLKSRR